MHSDSIHSRNRKKYPTISQAQKRASERACKRACEQAFVRASVRAGERASVHSEQCGAILMLHNEKAHHGIARQKLIIGELFDHMDGMRNHYLQ